MFVQFHCLSSYRSNRLQVTIGRGRTPGKRAYVFSCRIFLSSTINGYFGSGIMTKSGIILNNEMADFSIPGVQNVQGAGPPTVRNPPLTRVTSWNVVSVLLARYAVFPVWGGLRDEPNVYNFNVFILRSVRFWVFVRCLALGEFCGSWPTSSVFSGTNCSSSWRGTVLISYNWTEIGYGFQGIHEGV